MIYCIYEVFHEPIWFSEHFYFLNENTVSTQKVMNICILVISYYSWEMSTNRYAKLQKSIAVHHWLSCIAAMTIVYLDRFSPLITWYAIVGLFSAGIPINAALFLRAHAAGSKKLGVYIQRSLKFAAYWYLCHLIVLFFGACVIMTNQWISGYYDRNIGRIILFILTLISMCAFLYNDIITLRALFQLSTHDYGVLSKKHPKSSSNTKSDGPRNWEKSATKRPNSNNPRGVLKIGHHEYSQLTLNSNNPNLTRTNFNSNVMDFDPDSYWYEAYPISGTRTEFTRQIHNGIIDGNWVDETTRTGNGLGHVSMPPSADFTFEEYPHRELEITKAPTDNYSLKFMTDRHDTDHYTEELRLNGIIPFEYIHEFLCTILYKNTSLIPTQAILQQIKKCCQEIQAIWLSIHQPP